MVVCPSCGSSRIRNDYKPAPIMLRLLGIRGLLCDNCNFPFRAFSPLPPKSRRPRQHKRKADVFNSAPVVDLSQIRHNPPAEKTELRLVTPTQEKMDLAVSAASSTLPQARIITEHIAPVRTDLRTEITRIHVQGEREPIMKESPLLRPPISPAANGTPQTCPECDSRNVRRRHRSFFERTFLSFTEHKAYNCRNCGISFYAKSEKPQSHPSAVG